MKFATAQSAGLLAAQIERVQRLLADIDMAINEQWPVSQLRVAAPATGASQPEGTEVDLLAGTALPIADLWKIALTTARASHQSVLADLTAQLETL